MNASILNEFLLGWCKMYTKIWGMAVETRLIASLREDHHNLKDDRFFAKK